MSGIINAIKAFLYGCPDSASVDAQSLTSAMAYFIHARLLGSVGGSSITPGTSAIVTGVLTGVSGYYTYKMCVGSEYSAFGEEQSTWKYVKCGLMVLLTAVLAGATASLYEDYSSGGTWPLSPCATANTPAAAPMAMGRDFSEFSTSPHVASQSHPTTQVHGPGVNMQAHQGKGLQRGGQVSRMVNASFVGNGINIDPTHSGI